MPNDPEKPLPVSSSQPPVFPTDQEALFREVIELMNRNQVQVLVSGAFALHEHTGIWRDTKDLDLFMPANEVGPALGLLEKDGFQTEVLDPVWLAKAWRNGYFVDLITGMSNGVIRVDQSWIERAGHSMVFGTPVRTLAPEELIASKIFVTRRERFDGADICHVIYSARGRLDWGRLFGLAGEHWEMLLWHLVLYHYVYPAHAEYVPQEIWDQLLQRFKIELRSANKHAQFRGSLVDEKMFAIDVEEWEKHNLLDHYQNRAELIKREEQ